MSGEQALLGVLDYIEEEVLPDAPRLARFALKLIIRFARDWRTIRRYIDKAGERLNLPPSKGKKNRGEKAAPSTGGNNDV